MLLATAPWCYGWLKPGAERGTSEPSTTNLVKVARLYGVDPAELLREVEG